MDGGQWSPASRSNYNLRDGISRCTVQVLGGFESFLKCISFNYSCTTIYSRPDTLRSKLFDASFIHAPFRMCSPAYCAIEVKLNFHICNFYTGLSKVMDCPLHASGQCWDVECQIRELGSSILGTAILSSRIFSCKFIERRVSYSKECSPMWSSIRSQDKAILELKKQKNRHEGVTGFPI